MHPRRADPAKRHFRLEEVFVGLALGQAFPGEAVHLHPALAAVDLAPDLVVGAMAEPRMVASVTRLSAQNAVQVKAWRDLYELALYRRQQPRTRVVRVLFGPPGAGSWNQALAQVFDLHQFVRELPGGEATERLLHGLTDEAAGVTDDPGVRLWLDARLDADARQCLAHLAGRLSGCRRRPGGPVTPVEAIRVTEPFAPTALRRAVILLGIFPELHVFAGLNQVAAIGEGGHGGSLERQDDASVPPKWFGEMGFLGADKMLLGPWRGWVEGAKAAVGRQTLGALAAEAVAPSRRVRTRMLQVSRTLEIFDAWFARLAARDDPGRHLAGALRMDAVACAACGGHPVLLALRNLLKLDGGDAFGNARLLEHLGLGRDTSDLYRVSRWFSGQEPPNADADWAALWPWFETAAARRRTTPGLERRLLWPLFYDEAMKNRQVEPLGSLVREALGGRGAWQVRHPTFLDPAGAVGTVRCWRLNNTVFHWKSAHDGHRDKTKELAAKGLAMRAFAPKERFVLVLDGDFAERDLDSLAASGGWDWVIPVSSWRAEGKRALGRL